MTCVETKSKVYPIINSSDTNARLSRCEAQSSWLPMHWKLIPNITNVGTLNMVKVRISEDMHKPT